MKFERTLQHIASLGNFIVFCKNVFYWSVRTPFRLRLLNEQFYEIGNRSIFIIVLIGSFSGMVLTFQTYAGFSTISADSFVGPIVALGLAKEMAPVFTGIILTGRCVAAMAAQLGSMKVTEQVDALEVMGIDPIQYLAVPRVWASFWMTPILSCIFLFLGNLCAWLIAVYVLGIDNYLFFSKLGTFVHYDDIFQGVLKAFAFGLIIALVGTYQGLNVRGGADGVGRATNMAVVWGMVLVLSLDFFLTTFISRIL